jgi:imidazolonepropionase-like amidohydrolase
VADSAANASNEVSATVTVDLTPPRIVAATYEIGATGGHCDTNQYPAEFDFPRPGIADGPDAIRGKVRELHRRGAEVIKFCATGGVFSSGTSLGAQQYSQAEMDALVAEAESAIALLQERRSALISAAVTGQIDVRNAVPEVSA